MPSQQTNNTGLYEVTVECVNGDSVKRLVPAETRDQAVSRAQRRSDWPDTSTYTESNIEANRL